MKKRMNAAMIEALRAKDQTISEAMPSGGSLVARRLSNSTSWRYHYRHNGQTRKYTFGSYSAKGDGTGAEDSTEFTLAGARKRAAKLSALYIETGDIVAHYAEKRTQASEKRLAADNERQQRQQQTRDYSLENLCKAYWEHLEKSGKPSSQAVRNGLTRWVITKQPTLAKKLASEVTTADVLLILRTIIDAKHTTTTNRVRSYLRAAYTFGIGSTTDPLASSRAAGFRLTNNPVAATTHTRAFEQAGERVLNEVELAEFMRRLKEKESPASYAALLSLRLGGQRIKQLLAVTPGDVDESTITLRDSKGRRDKPRRHVLPITDATRSLIRTALENQHPQRPGLYGGLVTDTVSKQVRAISKEMEAHNTPPFAWRDLRRTCETMLSKMGISKDLRAQLLSHGLGGVQDRHYDRHDYLKEKENALNAWNMRLDELKIGTAASSNVMALGRR